MGNMRGVCAMVVGIVVGLSVAAGALASFPGTDVFVPSVGHGAGSGGSQWRTTLWIFNPGEAGANCRIELLMRGGSNPEPAGAFNLTVGPGDTVRFDDAVWALFGVEGYGALRVTSSAEVVVNSRIFNQEGDDIADTQGQFFPAIPAGFSIGPGETTDILGVDQAGDGAFRYNFGIVETSGHDIVVEATLLDGEGNALGGKAYTLGPFGVMQVNVSDLGTGTHPTANGRIHVFLRPESEGSAIVFGSGIANASQDPSTFEMTMDATGGGTGGDLSLPYRGTGSSSGSLFAVENTGSGTAVEGRSDGGTGVLADTDSGSAVRARASSTSGAAIQAENTARGISVAIAAERGVDVECSECTAVKGVSEIALGGFFSSTNGKGLRVSSTNNIGIDVSSTSNTGIDATVSGGNPAVLGKNLGDGAAASFYAADYYAVFARSDSAYEPAVEGRGFVGGVYGKAYEEGCAGVLGLNEYDGGYGIWGYAGIRSLAGHFTGDVEVFGSLTKSSGSFKIDHPLDPEHKYLYHSFVESPDMMNIYNGNVVTDASGYATVTLPDWFEALNRDFRYQLTVIGGGDQWALARVARKIEDNTFVIQTSAPYVEVSWQVTGIRHDPWAEAHRIPVEEEKPEAEQDHYIHPELYGATVRESVEAGRNPAFMERILQDR